MAIKLKTASCKQEGNNRLAGATDPVLIAKLLSARYPYPVSMMLMTEKIAQQKQREMRTNVIVSNEILSYFIDLLRFPS